MGIAAHAQQATLEPRPTDESPLFQTSTDGTDISISTADLCSSERCLAERRHLLAPAHEHDAISLAIHGSSKRSARPVQHVPRTHAVVEAFRNASRPSHCPVSNNRNRLIIGAERTVRSAKLCSTSNAQSIHPHHTTPPLTAQALPPRCMQHARSSTQFTRAPQPRPRRLRAKSRLSVHWHVPERFPYR